VTLSRATYLDDVNIYSLNREALKVDRGGITEYARLQERAQQIPFGKQPAQSIEIKLGSLTYGHKYPKHSYINTPSQCSILTSVICTDINPRLNNKRESNDLLPVVQSRSLGALHS